MSLQSRLSTLITAIGVDIKALNTAVATKPKIYQGSGVPSGALGVIGDWYIMTNGLSFYEKTGAAAWTLRYGSPRVWVGVVDVTWPGASIISNSVDISAAAGFTVVGFVATPSQEGVGQCFAYTVARTVLRVGTLSFQPASSVVSKAHVYAWN